MSRGIPSAQRIAKGALLAACLTAAAAAAQTGGANAETVLKGNPMGEPSAIENTGTPPSLTVVRYNEDYAYLRDPAKRSGAWWEPFKYMPFNASGDVYLTLGGEIRFEPEFTWNSNWGETTIDKYEWYRVLPYADLHLGPKLRMFGQVIGAWAVDKLNPVGIDETGFDTLQAFADIRLPVSENAELTLRVGRQMLSIGSERLIGSRYGPNVPLSFDMGRALFEWGATWRTDAFYGRPVRSKPGDFNDRFDHGRSVWGAYTSHKLSQSSPASGLDFYYIGYRNAAATFNQGTGAEVRHTVGSRFFGKANSWDWNSEAMFQFGTFGAGDIRAWSVQSDTGYTLSNRVFSPRIGLKANIISGDRNAGDATLQTFNSMFPKGQYFGELVLVGPTNLINVHPSLTLHLNDQWVLFGDAAFFWRESLGDGIYDPGGNLLRAAGDSRSRSIGTQTDIGIGWQPVRWFSVDLAYGVFKAGSFVRDTGPSKTARYLSLQMAIKF